jgi:hypothetical protein
MGADNTSGHRWELNALRGLMLVLMTLTHLPTRLSDPLGQPFGFVSAAEGFVMLSAYMAGWVYTLRHRKHGEDEMRSAFMKRALKIWLVQIALLLFAFTAIALIGIYAAQPAVNDLLHFYRERPLTAFLAGMLLIYSPPLLDILPMYVLFMLASPLLLLHGLRGGWRWILAGSVLLWVAAQWELGRMFYETLVAPTKLPVPLPETGAFDIFAWQFLWVFGLWLGSSHAVGAPVQPRRFPTALVVAAALFAGVCLVWRHAVGQQPFPQATEWNFVFDKWRLAPLRLIDFFALLVLTMHFGDALKRLPRVPALETLGAQALPVFCAHLVIVLLVLATLGPIDPQRPWALDLLLAAGTLGALYAVAWTVGEIDRRSAAARARLKARREQRRASRLSAAR